MPSTLIKQFEGLKPGGFPFGFDPLIPRAFTDPGDVSETLLPAGVKILNGRLVFLNEARGHAWEKIFPWPVHELITPEYQTGFIYGFGFDAFETEEDTKFCSLAKYSTMSGSGDVTWKRTGGVCNGVTYKNVLADGFLKEWEWEFDMENLTMGPKLNEEGRIVTTDTPTSGGDTCIIGAPTESETTEKRHVGPITYTPTMESSAPEEDGATGTMEYELTSEVTLSDLRGLAAQWKLKSEAFRVATNSTAAPMSTETSDGQFAETAAGYVRYRAAEVDMPNGYELVLDCVFRQLVPPYRDFNRGTAVVSVSELKPEYVDVRTGKEFAGMGRSVVDESPMKIGLISGLDATPGASVIGAAVRLATRGKRYRVKAVWSVMVEGEFETTDTEITLDADQVAKGRKVSDWAYWNDASGVADYIFIALSIKDGEDFTVERWDEEDGEWDVVPTDEPGYQKKFGSFFTGIRTPEAEIWTEVKVVKGQVRGWAGDGAVGYRKRMLDASLSLEGESPEAGACGVALSGFCSYGVELEMDKWGNIVAITGADNVQGSVNGIDYSADDRNPEMKHPWYRAPELLGDQDNSGNTSEAAPVPLVARNFYPGIPFAGEEMSRTTISLPIRTDTEFGVRMTEWVAVPDPPSGQYVQLEYPRLRKG